MGILGVLWKYELNTCAVGGSEGMSYGWIFVSFGAEGCVI